MQYSQLNKGQIGFKEGRNFLETGPDTSETGALGPFSSGARGALGGTAPSGTSRLDENPSSSSRETPEGHVYELASFLSARAEARAQARAQKFAEGEEAPHEEFPDRLFRLPVPNEVFSGLSELSGCAVRLVLLVIRAAYRYDPEASRWRCSPRYFTRSDLEEAAEHGPGLSGSSITSAARELEEQGWLDIREGPEGQPDRFRCLLGAPSSGFTWIPTALFEAHSRLSHSALKVLLCVYRATWGWTRKEARKGGRTTVHKVRAPMSNDELAGRAGLSIPTVRSAVRELREKGLVERDRPHHGSPFFYRTTERFFAPHRQKIYTPSSRVKNKNKQRPPAREERPPRRAPDTTQDAVEPTKRNKKGRASNRRRPKANRKNRLPAEAEELDGREAELFRILTGPEFDLSEPFAAKMVRRRSNELIRRTLDGFHEQRRKTKIRSPGGWMRKALEDLWFAPKTSESIPTRSRRRTQREDPQSAGKVFGKVLEEMQEENQGWEWDPEGDTADRARPEAKASGPPTEEEAGVPHPEMCDLIHALNRPPGDWDCRKRDGKPNLFVPSKELANWCWKWEKKAENDQFQRAARKVVSIRAAYEDREDVPRRRRP